MNQSLNKIALLVRDYDEAIHFFTGKLRFTLEEDIDMGNGKRWVVVQPPGSEGTGLLLAKAKDAHQQQYIGQQGGGRVFLFLHTDDFWRDYESMKEAGISFAEEPREEVYGTVVVWEDLYGNKWDLVQPK